MGLGTTAVITNQKRDPSGPPFVIGSARNGASVDGAGAIVLGNDVGGVAAVLLNNREIPTAGFDIRLSGLGNLVIGSNAGLTGKLQIIGTVNGVQELTKLPAGQTIANPFYRVTDSVNAAIFEMRTLTPANIFLGVGVGATTTTGQSNIGIGGTAFGATTLSALTTGNQNVAVGVRALMANTTGNANTALGDACLFANISGTRCVAIGQAALAFTTANNDNIGIGQNAGHGAGSNYDRVVVIGSGSYSQNTGGSDNVCVGYQAGATNGLPGAHGTGNVVLGSTALAGQVMGDNNVLIGFQNNQLNIVGSSVICIGAKAQVTSLNNVTTIGTAMSSAVANVAVLGRADQNIILGVTAVAADNGNRLQVNGSISFSNAASMLRSVVAMTDGAGVAIGTLLTAPTAGDPTKWIGFDDNGTIRYIPAW